MKDIPSEVVIENTHKWFNVALVMIVISGIFMSSAVALKLYYNTMFWAKMASLTAGVVFVYAIRRPLLKFDHASIKPITLRMIAITSILIWFTVAASGRWIGFS
jgi:ABC-type bacteriocin/lantibiotic exporter with double-glycine peptidase domain